jgi:hypothetical protein
VESLDVLDAIGVALSVLRRRKPEGSQLSLGDDTQVTMDWFLDDGQSSSEFLEESGVHVIEPFMSP